MLIDTDVLIWHLRGSDKASLLLDSLTEPAFSAVTYLEVLQGVRS
jgi:predicted nucleic acid-binding protein